MKHFSSDEKLNRELMEFGGFDGHPLGIVLISSNSYCNMCGGNLLVRSDRPSFPVVYTESFGTIGGTHFQKYCQNTGKGCPFTQHYGFHSIGNDSEVIYDKDYCDLPYFLSSTMTAFETEMLHHLTAEILLGQITYHQKADIYNYIHGYDTTNKGVNQAVYNLISDATSSMNR